jgi:uncharacterized membrane protein YhaH (DUF805 family)
MKEKLMDLLYDITDSGIFAVIMWAAIISLIIWKPIILLWFLAFIGVMAIVTILGANFTGG